MNHFRMQSLWRTQSLWNAVGDESSVTSFSTPKPRRTIMKKLTHIAAPVALTALLSACAAPGPEQVTLENLGPGVLEMIQNEAAKTLTNPGPDGGLSPVQQAAQDAVDKALGAVTNPKPLLRSVDFKFDLLGADDRARMEIYKMLDDLFMRKVAGMVDGDEVTVPDRDPVRHLITYRVEDLRGMSEHDGRLATAELEISKIAEEKNIAPIRKDPGVDRPVTFKTEVRDFHAATGIAVARSACTVQYTFTLYEREDVAGRNVVVWIFDPETGELMRHAGSSYTTEVEGDDSTGPCMAMAAGVKHQYAMAMLDSPEVAEYHRLDLYTGAIESVQDRYTVGAPACPPIHGGWGTRGKKGGSPAQEFKDKVLEGNCK